MRTLGIDISHEQGSNGRTLKFHEEGADFIIHKATQRDSYVDPGYLNFAAKMSHHREIIPGAYHWLTQHSGKAQARHFVKTVRDGWGGNVPAEHIWAIDIEKPQTGLGDRYCSWPNFVELVQEFNRLVPESALWVYTRADIWYGYFTNVNNGPHNPNGRELGLLLWNAYWTVGNVSLAGFDPDNAPLGWYNDRSYGGWHATPIQQVTSNGHSNGYRLDIDVFDGPPHSLRALCSQGVGGGGTGGGDKCPTGYHKDSSGVCVPDTADCPAGQHKDANGICVPDDGSGGGNDEPWNDYTVQQQTIAAGITGIGVGSSATLLVVGVSVAILAVLYMAYKAGNTTESVRDSGERD